MSLSDADLAGMDEGELQDLVQRAGKALDRMVAKRARRTLKEAKRIAAEVGYEVTFTKPDRADRRRKKAVETKPAASSREKVAPKYRNPNNPSETWTGRGRQPKWVQAALTEGRTLSDLSL